MSEPTEMSVLTVGTRSARFAAYANLANPRFVACLFAGMLALQAAGFLLLGTSRHGMGFSGLILCFHDLLALVCVWIAFRRARGTAALFWFLFAVNLLCLMVPTVLMTASIILEVTLVSSSTWRVLFCLYGAPVLMALFLPEAEQSGRQRSQIFLDQFQVAIVVGVAYTTFFYLPLQRLLPSDALIRNLVISNLQSTFLLVAVLVRLQFAHTDSSRSLFRRLGVFVLGCALVTLIGNWIDLHGYATASAWFDMGWALSYPPAAFAAIYWRPVPEPESVGEPASFLGLVRANLVLVSVLFSLILMLDNNWRRAHGALLTNAAFAASLIAFTFRLALTQFGQQQEIVQRKTAQEGLSVANQTIGGLLEDARIETSAITQISELGALLQACASRDEAYLVIPERMVLLFPGTSGGLSLLNPSRTRAESVAVWGPRTLTDDDSPSRNRAHPEGASLSIPLIAHDEVLGVLLIRDDGPPTTTLRASLRDEPGRRQRLASALAEHIALTISNLDLRAALQTQAIRDPLTGLYNRRYMQEALERELHRARRRERPLSVMLLDIDHFKRYNDTFGHSAGDDALRLVSETLMASVRAEDLACRFGGEEFVVILPECALPQAAIRAEEVRTRLRELYVERPGELPEVVTVSIGVAAFQETTGRMDLLLKFADEALYQAKHEGRDRIVVSQPDLTDPHRSPPSGLSVDIVPLHS